MIRAGAAVALVALAPRVAGAQTVPPPPTPVERASRYTGLALYGAAAGGAAALLADRDGPALTVALPLLGAGAGLAAAYVIDTRVAMRRGVDTAVTAGLTLGALAGGAVAWEGVAGGGWSPGAAGAAVWGGMTVGLGAGLALEGALRPDPGTTSWLVSGALYGAALAGLTGLAAGDGEALGRWSAVGAGAGAIAALATAGALRPTQARTRWTDLGAALGAALGLGAGVLLFARPSLSVPGVVATTQLGMLGGAVAGYVLSAPDDDGRATARLALGPGPGGLGLSVMGATP